jgi:hypothetical protein
MPDDRHLFRGIHSPDLVAASVQVTVSIHRPARGAKGSKGGALAGELSLFNDSVGHDFPTYSTPRILLQVELEDSRGASLGPVAEKAIARTVQFERGAWTELADTRVAPRQKQVLAFSFPDVPRPAVLHTRVLVEPDFAYVGIYEALLATALDAPHRALLEQALAAARRSPYVIHDQRQTIR